MIYLTENFNSRASGSVPAGFASVKILAASPGTWQVGTPGVVASPKAFTDPTSKLSAGWLYTGMTPVADGAIQFTQVVQLDGGGLGFNVGPFIRASADGNNGFLVLPDFAGQFALFFAVVAGSPSVIGSAQPLGMAFAAGDVVLGKAEASGTTIRLKLWKQGASEPGAWTASVTSSAVTAPGYFGGYVGNNNGAASGGPPAIYDLFIGDAGSAFGTGPPLVIVLPAVASATITDSLATVMIDFADLQGNPTDLVSIATPPTLTKNGVTPLTPFGQQAMADRLLYFLSSPLASGDTVTVGAADRWATTAAGDVQAVNLVASKASILPALPTGTPTMPLGWNVPCAPVSFDNSNTHANLAHRIQGWDSGASAINSLGYPTAISGPWASADVSVPPDNGVDGLGMPNMPTTGPYTMTWRGTAHRQNGIDPFLELQNYFGVGTYTERLGSRVLDDGGKNTLVYDITVNSTSYAPKLKLVAYQTGGAFSLSDIQIYGPGVATDGSQRFTSQHLARIAGATVLRSVNFVAWDSNVVDFPDFRDADSLGYGGGVRNTGGFVASIGPYVDTSNLFGVLGVPLLVTFSSPHGIKEGNIVTLTATSGGPHGTGFLDTVAGHTVGLNGLIEFAHVVSPTSIAMLGYYNGTLPDVLASTYTSDGTWICGGQPNPGGPLIDFIDACNAVGAHAYFCLPFTATDACAFAVGQFFAQNLTPGRKLYFELGDEWWNNTSPTKITIWMARLGAQSGIGAAQYYVKRSCEVQDQALAGWIAGGGSPADFRRVLGTNGGDPGTTQAMIDYASVPANHAADPTTPIPVHTLVSAPYVSCNVNDGFNRPAVAMSGSVGDQLSVGQVADVGDLMALKAGYPDHFSLHYPILHVKYPAATMAGYEGGAPDTVPASALSAGPSLQHRLHLWGNNPRIVATLLYYFNAFQAAGSAYNGIEFFCYFDEAGLGTPWDVYRAWNQVDGLGDGTDGLFDNSIPNVNGLPYEALDRMVSPRGLAWRRWKALESGTPTPTPTPSLASLPGIRDWDVLSAIRDALAATSAFDGVHLSAGPDSWGVSGGEGRMAVVLPESWDETDTWDDEDTVSMPRRLAFVVEVHVRIDDPELRDREADRLTAVVQDAIDGQSLSGLTLPPLTKIRRGRWAKAVPPERAITLAGEATYLVAGFSGHDTTD